MSILQQPSMAILIDCWDATDKGPYAVVYENIYRNIIDFINKTPAIKIVVLATYDSADFIKESNNIWYTNQQKLLGLNQTTDKIILNYLNTSKLQVAITDFDKFMGFLGDNPEIENLYFMGISWDDCLQNRPVGMFRCLCTDKNLLVNPKCVLKDVDSLGLDLRYNNRYKKLSDDVYQLKVSKDIDT